MDISRAKEILKTDRTIDVKLDGVPVWINSVDTATSTVNVHLKNNPANQRNVPAEQLQEV